MASFIRQFSAMVLRDSHRGYIALIAPSPQWKPPLEAISFGSTLDFDRQCARQRLFRDEEDELIGRTEECLLPRHSLTRREYRTLHKQLNKQTPIGWRVNRCSICHKSGHKKTTCTQRQAA